MTISHTFNIVLPQDDLIESSVEWMRHTTAGRKRIKTTRSVARTSMLIGTIFAALLVCQAIFREGTWILTDGAGIPLLFAVAAWVAALILWRSVSPAGARAAARNRARAVAVLCLRQPHTITLTPEGFRFAGDGMATELAWKHFEEVVGGERFILLVKHDATAHVVPRAIVGDAPAQEALIAQCRTWIEAGGGGAAYAVVALLFDRDVPCPKCQYNLRNQTRPLCPECGTALNQHDLYATILQAKAK